MKWSWKLGNFLGIGVYIHATFLLLIGWIVLTHLLQGKATDSLLTGILFTLAVFLCVLLHEYGHALAARRFGINTRDITLLPIGGVARLERMPDKPRQELCVALAGPAVNVAIAGAIFILFLATGSTGNPAGFSMADGSFLQKLLVVNIFLALFNMLPAFPMDGGRVLRALLATRLPYTRATRIASYFGQGMALLFALGGLFGNPFLLFIAFFVWIGAAQEFAAVEAKSALGGLAVGGAMITDYRHLNPSDTLSRAVDLVLSGSQQDFPVVDDERVVGILTTPDLIMALSKHGQDKKVEDVMINTVESADVSDPIESVFEKLKACDCSMMPVLKNGRLAGLITAENVSELLVIRAALSMRVGEAAGTQHLSHSR